MSQSTGDGSMQPDVAAVRRRLRGRLCGGRPEASGLALEQRVFLHQDPRHQSIKFQLSCFRPHQDFPNHNTSSDGKPRSTKSKL
jgi:hypothetical protein